MLENNNRRIICRMAKSSVKKNSGRNWILFLAILLASFMLFSIFTVGITYFKMYRIQNIRLNGGDYDAVLYGITEEQREKCEADPDPRREPEREAEPKQGDEAEPERGSWPEPKCGTRRDPGAAGAGSDSEG